MRRCCRAFGCNRVGTGVACLAPWGSLGRLLDILLHMSLHLTLFGELRNPTSHAVWGISNPYISRCVANAPVCLPFIFPFSLLSSLQQFQVVLFSLFMFHFVTCLMMFGTKAAIVEWIFLVRPHRVFFRVGGRHAPTEGAWGPSSASAARFRCRQRRRHRARRVARQCAQSAGDSAAQGQ